MLTNGKVLGIDHGDKRIGVAVSDNQRQIAFRRQYIENTNKTEVIQTIKTLCEQDQITLIVVGLPINMEGDDTDQTRKVRKFSKALGQAVNLKIVLYDERLTTRRSDAILTSIGKRGKERKQERDSIAASLILQNYLDLLGKRQGREKGDNHI